MDSTGNKGEPLEPLAHPFPIEREWELCYNSHRFVKKRGGQNDRNRILDFLCIDYFIGGDRSCGGSSFCCIRGDGSYRR